MKVEIGIQKIIKEIVSKETFELPDIPTYYFQPGLRRSIALIPKWTTWRVKNKGIPEEIWEYDIIYIYSSLGYKKVEYANFRVSDIDRIYNDSKHGLYELIYFLFHWAKDCGRTKENFMEDYKAVINSHLEILEEPYEL